jgi:phosphoribulokinase
MARARTTEQSRAMAGRPIMVAVAGDSGAGKTTLASGLVDGLGRRRAVPICVGDYHRYDRAERKALSFTVLHPQCNYIAIMEQHLRLLADGHPVLKPVYNHLHGTLERPELIEPREYIVCEGVLPLHTPAARSCFDLSVYLDTDEPLRHAWKVERDVADRGYGVGEVWRELERREPESEAFVRPQRSHADVVVRFRASERGEAAGRVGATLLVRPRVALPELTTAVCCAGNGAIRRDVVVDEDRRYVDSIEVSSDAPPAAAPQVAATVSTALGLRDVVPEALGYLDGGTRSGPLALTQLILIFHLLALRRSARTWRSPLLEAPSGFARTCSPSGERMVRPSPRRPESGSATGTA